jgi:hypothetical protein
MLYYNFFISNGKKKSIRNKHYQHLKWLIILWTHPYIIFGRFRSMPYIYHFNDRYSSSPRVGSVDVAAPSFILELVFRVVAF